MKQLLAPALLFLTMTALTPAQTPDHNVVPIRVAPQGDSTVADNSGGSASRITGGHQQQQNTYVRPDAETRRKRYLKGLFGPMALGKTVASAGISTWTNSPEEWGGQWKGFGKRVASNMGQRLINNTVTYGFDEALKLDSHFYVSEKKDFGSRVGNAVISSVTARKPNGKRAFGLPRILGIYTSNVVSREAWYPSRYSYKDGLRSGTVSVGMSVIYNLITEFITKK